MKTRHAEIRAQQRGIPPLMDELLDRYGHEEHDGHGAVVLYLSKQSIRQIERDWGQVVVTRLSGWLNAYKVKSSDGETVTIGHRTRRIRRR